MAEINIGAITEALNNKSDIDLNNLNSIGQEKLDGEWVVMPDFTPVVQNLSMNSSTYLELDLTDFLPKDNYTYECNLSATITTTSTSGNAIYVSLATPQSPNNWFDLCQVRTRTSSVMNAMGSSIIPVGTDRKIILYRGTNINGTLNSLKLNAYRRLGKTN